MELGAPLYSFEMKLTYVQTFHQKSEDPSDATVIWKSVVLDTSSIHKQTDNPFGKSFGKTEDRRQKTEEKMEKKA